MNNSEIKKILENSKTIAMVGVSSEKKGEDPKNLKETTMVLLYLHLLQIILSFLYKKPFCFVVVLMEHIITDHDLAYSMISKDVVLRV